jgi:hypothetical protein
MSDDQWLSDHSEMDEAFTHGHFEINTPGSEFGGLRMFARKLPTELHIPRWYARTFRLLRI